MPENIELYKEYQEIINIGAAVNLLRVLDNIWEI